ncbi:MAG: hypothetical protein HW384_1409 [Dehalococcoidia bacterium]|nr:hypothetical protein [Dehalococcoidia bacterium]
MGREERLRSMNHLPAVISSAFAASSAVSFHFPAAILAETCSGFLAPAITVLTYGLDSNHAMASSPTVWPLSEAKSSNLDSLLQFASFKTPLYSAFGLDKRPSSGDFSPFRYFPVRNPCEEASR